MSILDQLSGMDIPQDHLEAQQVPFIQFLRGTGSGKKPVNTGAFELPLDRWELFLGNDFPYGSLETITSPNGKDRQSYLTTELNISILTYVQLWTMTDPANPMRFNYIQDYEPGAKGKLKVLGFIKELEDFYPDMVMLTLSGMNGKYVKDAIQQFQKLVIGGARKMYQKQLPRYFFWCTLRCTGEKITVGSGPNTGYITPPSFPFTEMSEETIDQLFVGADRAKLYADQFEMGQQWRTEQLNLWNRGNPPAAQPQSYKGQPTEPAFPVDDIEDV